MDILSTLDLKAPETSVRGVSLQVVKDPVAFYSPTPSLVGAIVITMPASASATMAGMRLEGYEYTTGTGAWSVLTGGYIYSANNTWLQYAAQALQPQVPVGFNVSGVPTVRLGCLVADPTKRVVILGDTTSVWQYPGLRVAEAQFTYSGWSQAWEVGWTITGAVVDLSPYTNIVSIPVSGVFSTTTPPAIAAAGAVGTGITLARADHNHSGPTIAEVTAKVAKAGDTMTGGLAMDGPGLLQLKPGASDHSYLGIYARTATPGTRNAYVGYGSAATTTLTVANEISGGAISLTPTGAGAVYIGGSQPLNLAADPTSNLQAATKQYVDNLTTAAGLMAKIQTVDGAGSGLDADLLDGKTSTDFLVNRDWTMIANTFGGRKLWQSDLHNALFLAPLRWNVSGNIYNKAGDTLVRAMTVNEVATLFDGDYESFFTVPLGQYIKVLIDFSNTTYFPGYPYGTIFTSFYYNYFPESITMRMYCNYAPHGVGWKDLTPSLSYSDANAQIWSAYNGFYQMSQLEITIKSPNAGQASGPTMIDFNMDRPATGNEMPYVDKYKANTLYKPLTIKSNLDMSGYDIMNARFIVGQTNVELYNSAYNRGLLTHNNGVDVFSDKQINLNGQTINISGSGVTTVSGTSVVTGARLETITSQTATAPIRIAPGAAPTSPVNGDLWTTSAGVYTRVNGVTVGPLIGSTDTVITNKVLKAGDTMTGPLTVATGDANGIRFSAVSSIVSSSLNSNTISATAGGSGNIYLTTLGTGNIAIQSQNALSLESVTQYIQVRSELDMAYDKITSLGTPTAPTDAATKAYVDGLAGGGAEVFAQAAAPAPGSVDVVWVDIDDTSLGSDSSSPHTHAEYATSAYVDQVVTVDTVDPVGAPARDGLLWVVV